LPNVGPYIYDVSISGFTRSSIYIYDISSLRVNKHSVQYSSLRFFQPSPYEGFESKSSSKSPSTIQGGIPSRIGIQQICATLVLPLSGIQTWTCGPWLLYKHTLFRLTQRSFMSFVLMLHVSVAVDNHQTFYANLQYQGNILLCGNKMPTRCNRGFYCRSYCLFSMFRATLCPSSGVKEYYSVVAACGISCCGFRVAGLVWS